MATLTKKRKRVVWTQERRESQSGVMTKNLNRHWDSVLTDPKAKNELMRERSVGFARGHKLSLWRCDLRVNLTDKELGAVLGVSEMTVSNWQNNRSKPQQAVRIKLENYAKEIGVPLDMSWAD